MAKHRTRRSLLLAGLALPSFMARSASATATLKPTPACGASAATESQSAGPFFTPDSPAKTDLRADDPKGPKILLTGLVMTTRCQPVTGALVDIWHADSAGRYDNDGYRLRGHTFTDAAGRYRFETIVPGRYGFRTRHYHVKVQAPNRPVLTTQLYFPDQKAVNERDFLFDASLLMVVDTAQSVPQAMFDFVIDRG